MFQLLFLGSVLAVPFLVLLLGLLLVRTYDVRSNRTKYKFYALTFPNELRTDQVIDWWASVASTFANSSILPSHQETVVIELRSDVHGLTHRLGIPWQHTELLGQLRAHLQGVHTIEHRLETRPEWSHAMEAGVSDRTLQLDVEKIEAQAKRLLTAASDNMKEGDSLAIQLVISAVGKSGSQIEPFNWRFLAGIKPRTDQDTERRAKQAQNQFKMVLRVVAAASTLPRAKKLVSNVRSGYKALNTPSVQVKKTMTLRKRIIEDFNHAYAPLFYPAQVSAQELVALSGWPLGAPIVAGLTVGRTRYLPPNETISRDGRRLGNSVYDTYNHRPIAISAVDACRHMYVIGPSGLGKTTMLTNSLQQDIEKGNGVVVIESKGDLFRAALDAVPRERLDDVVYMDFTDIDYPVGLNLLQEGGARVVDDLINLFASGSSDIYLRDEMYHGFHTLRHFPDLTIIDLLPFLNPQTPMEKAWREHLVDSLPKNGELQQHWKMFDNYSANEKRQRIQPVANRMWQLTNRRDVRNMLGQSKSTIDLKSIMEQNKLLFIYVPDSLGDDTVSLLTSLIFKASWDAVRAVQKTKPTYMYFDEVQKLKGFVDLEETLSLARSYKLGLVMAHQYTDQLPQKLFSAITNASTQVAFKLDGPDASKMANLFGKAVTPDDFMNLEPYEVIARLATPGGSSQPTVIKTLSPFKPHGHGEEVIRRSRAQFARKAGEVDREILKRRSAPMKPAKARPSFGDVRRDDDE